MEVKELGNEAVGNWSPLLTPLHLESSRRRTFRPGRESVSRERVYQEEETCPECGHHHPMFWVQTE